MITGAIEDIPRVELRVVTHKAVSRIFDGADEAFKSVKAQLATIEPHPVVMMFLTALAEAH